MNIRVTLDVTLVLYGPILTQSSSAPRYGVDAAMARNENGKYYIPGTLVKGRLCQAWEELGSLLNITDDNMKMLLGSGSGSRKDGKGVDPDRGAMQFTDFCTSTGSSDEVMFRIRMDEKRKAVDSGAYLVMEAPFAAGEKVEFKGCISFYAKDDAQLKKIKNGITAGLKWNHSFGSERTVGFGRLKDVLISEIPQAAKQVAPAVSKNRFDIAIRPDAAFCLGERQVKENLFDSNEVIAGNVIKGAIASTWGMLLDKGKNTEIVKGFDSGKRELSEWFEKVRFTHAFPSASGGGKRPSRIPLSLVKGCRDTLKDVALCKDAILVDGAAPAFSIDWKEWGDVNKRFGWPYINKELRVRTALNRESRKADDKKLFAYEMINPEGLEWLGTVDLSRVDETAREAVKSQLVDLLLHGLHGWSKTKTSATVAISDSSTMAVPAKVGDYYIVTLQTPALLIEPGDLDETSCREQLAGIYNKVWSELSNANLELFNYFATQSLTGGYYLHKRFRDGKDYYPWILTDAGSVFVLKAIDEAGAAEKIKTWLERGLDLPKWVDEKYERNGLKGNHWKNCPYLPENGFGEIRLTEELLDVAKEAKK